MTPAPGTGPAGDVDTRPTPAPSDGDHDRFAHIVRAEDQMRGYVMGEEVKALCGKRFVPTRDPTRYPVCPDCKARLDGWGATLG